MAGDKRHSPEWGDWMQWLNWLGEHADPLGLHDGFARSMEALDQVDDPEQAITQLTDWITRWSEALEAAIPETLNTQVNQQPSLGPFPERQDLLRAITTQTLAYQNALAEHLSGLTDLIEHCIAAFKVDLAEHRADSTTSLSDRWIAIAEPRYEAWLAEPQTQARIAAAVNAWSALAQSLRRLIDDGLQALGLPASRDIDDLGAELQRQRRRHRQDIAELRDEIAALRAQLKSH